MNLLRFNTILCSVCERIAAGGIHHALVKPPLPLMQAHGIDVWHIQQNVIYENTISPYFTRHATAMRVR